MKGGGEIDRLQMEDERKEREVTEWGDLSVRTE